MSASYDYDEYDSDDDSESVMDLPLIVTFEMNRREKDPSSPPASVTVQNILRDWFLQGGDPSLAGGYITICEKLGVSSKVVCVCVSRSLWYDQ